MSQARVAELADAEDSKSFGRKVVRVQVPPRAPNLHKIAIRRPQGSLIGIA